MEDPHPKSWFGFLGVSMLFGCAVGFLPFEMHAGSDGHVWDSDGYVTRMMISTVIGGVIGLGFGGLLRAAIPDRQQQRKTVAWLWMAFVVCCSLYLLLRPALTAVR